MATNTSPARTCRQSVVQLVTRILGSGAPQRSRAPSSRSETPPAMVGRSFTRGLLACNVLGIFWKGLHGRRRERDALPTTRPDGRGRAETRQGEFRMVTGFNLCGRQQLFYM